MELIVNFSGGKDSCAMLHFLCMNYPTIKKHIVFADTGWEHLDAIPWCKSIAERYNLELHITRNRNKDFLSMVRKRKMFPGMKQRQCTSDLKRDPIETWIRNNTTDKLIINCLGERSAESVERKKKKKLKRNKRLTNSKRTVWDWMPIKDWTTDQVFEYLQLHNIPLHSVYKYLPRFSCRVCIYMSPEHLKQVAKFDPGAIDIIAAMEQEIGFTMFQSGPIKSLAS